MRDLGLGIGWGGGLCRLRGCDGLRHDSGLLHLLGELSGLGRHLLDGGQRLDRGETGELEALSGDLGFCRGDAY